jgi:hypothetical protein
MPRAPSFCVIKVDRKRPRVDVDKNDVDSEVVKRGCRRRERQGRNQRGVAWTEPACFRSQVKSGCGGVHRHRLYVVSEKPCKLLLEFPALGPARQPAGAQYAYSGGDLSLSN